MNKSRKLMSLLLVLVLALPMVFVTVNALAATVVKTTGGRLNVWAGPIKTPGTAIASLKNGTVISKVEDKTYSPRDKRWMVLITAGTVRGWVDANYVGTRKDVVVKPVVPVGNPYDAKLVGTAPNSVINIWDSYGYDKEIKMKQAPLGYVFVGAQNYSNGWTAVTFKDAYLQDVVGWVQTKFLRNQTLVTRP